MPEPKPDPYVMLDSSFQSSSALRQSQHLPRRSDEYRTYSRTAAPLKRDYSYTTQATDTTDDTESTCGSQDSTPLASSGALNRAESGLPPTPPSASQDGNSIQDPEPPPLADSVRNSLMSQKSTLSTPVNARSPPTPDPSPPRTTASNVTPERPHLLTYPSSRADSFQTAREEPLSSDRDDSRSVTPAQDNRLSTVEEDRGLGLAFEYVQNDVTPTTPKNRYFPTTPTTPAAHVDTTAGAEEDKGSQTVDNIPDREWNTDLMRNVTIRKKRRPQTTDSPTKISDPAVTVVEAASPTPSNRTRRASSLRERVEASHNSPVTPSIENFAQSIGWPAEPGGMSGERYRDSTNKRLSTASVASTVVSAHVIITPPRRTQTLRHSGRNMAYRRDVSSPADLGPSTTNSNRNSMISQFDDLPPRRLVHKRTNIGDRSIRSSTNSNILGSDRIMSPSLSLRQRTIDSSAHTLAHQESIRNVLQPASDILSRHGSGARAGGSYHKRINSAPEPVKRKTQPSKLRNFSELSPPGSPRPREKPSTQAPKVQRAPSPTLSPKPRQASPTSRKSKRQTPVITDVKLPTGLENTLPDLPDQGIDGPAERDVFLGASHPLEETRVPPELMDRVRRLVAGDPTEEPTFIGEHSPNPATAEYLNKFSPMDNGSRQIPQGSRFVRPSSRDQKRVSPNRDNFSLSPDMTTRPGLNDRMSSEEMARRSPEWRRCSSGTPGRVSFDQSASRSASRMEEHAMARHLYSQSTPFSQFSDTVEVTEATAVSIYPHNNNSLLVVQQMSRGNSMIQERRQITTDTHMEPQGGDEIPISPTPPFVDAKESIAELCKEAPSQPTLNFEPSTPPMQIDLPQPHGVEIPLQNPRSPPKPPKIMFIPPTPMEELENQLAPGPPGPPQRSDSNPQRRLSVLQRARRYSGNLITPILARASNKPRTSESQSQNQQNPRASSVADEDGTLHPFWRPRGFWDGFSDSESESEEGGLPEGGDTSDIEDAEPEPPRRPNKLNKLKGGLRGSGGFLIGNSLGVERHGANKRRHQVTLPPNFPRQPRTRSTGRSSPPKVINQAPTHALGRHGGGGISKRRSTPELRRSPSLSDNVSIEYEQSRRRGSWRQGRTLPGLKKYHVQYIGLSGVKDKIREHRTEKRREKIRRSIGSRYYVEPVTPGSVPGSVTASSE